MDLIQNLGHGFGVALTLIAVLCHVAGVVLRGVAAARNRL